MNTKVTMYTIANELNMSVAAISRAFNPESKLNPEKRKLILSTAKKLGYVPNKMASRLSQATINIGVLIYGYMDVYDNNVIDGINAAYHELQGYKVECDIRHLKFGETSLEDALAVLDEFAEKNYDGILLTTLPDDDDFIGFRCKSSTFERNKLKELSEKNIKVGILDEDVADCPRLFVSMNNTPVAAGMAAELLKAFSKSETCNAGVFFSGKYDLLDQFCVKAENAGINVVATAALEISSSEDSNLKNYDVVSSMFSSHPEINGVYVNFANCIPICQYLEKNDPDNNIVLIASDIYDDMRPYLESGIINASIYQDPFSQGYNAFKNMYFSLAEKKEMPEHLLAHPQIILKSNMDLF